MIRQNLNRRRRGNPRVILWIVLAASIALTTTPAIAGVTVEFAPLRNPFVAGEDLELTLQIRDDATGETPRLNFFDISILLDLADAEIRSVMVIEPVMDYVFEGFEPGFDAAAERNGLISQTFVNAAGGVDEVVLGDGLFADSVALGTEPRSLATVTISTPIGARGPLTFEIDRTFGGLDFDNADPVDIDFALTRQSFTAVPEPTATLMMSALGVTFVVRRRRGRRLVGQ